MAEPWLIYFFACNREMQPFSFFFCWLFVRGGISGRVRALNLTVPLGSGRVGSDNLGYGPGSGFSFEPVQTSISHPVHPPCRLGHPKQDMKCCWSLQPEVIPLCVIISSVCGPITWVLGEECTSSKGGTWQGQRAEIRRCWYAIFTALNSGPPSLCFNQRWFSRAFSFSVQPSVRDVAAVWLFSVRQVCYKPVWNIITETLQV